MNARVLSTRYVVLLKAIAVAGFAIGTAVTVAAPKSPRVQTGPDAEVTYDGLHRVDRSVLDMAWVKPDLDLTGYRKLMVVSGGIAYREVDGPVNRRTSTEFPVSDEAKERFQQVVREEFLEELEQQQRYEITDQPGRDVLVLVGAIIDVVSRVPPEPIGRSSIYLSAAGDATLVLELRDSMSNEVLARGADRRAAEATFAGPANSVTVWSDVRRLAKAWAKLLRTRLEQLDSV
jgi:hypothetical protein